MQRSSDRFLTTHTGSLPRPEDLIRMMYAKEEGVPVDPTALAERVHQAVTELVKKQADVGIDLINDGEMSKPSYATYIRTGSTASAVPAIHSFTRISPSFRNWKSACSAIPAARAAKRRLATRRSKCAMRRRRSSMRKISNPPSPA
jgi:hypothetical protein